MRTICFLAALGFALSPSTLAAQALSSDQSTRLQAALDAQGCSGGNIRVGESGFEVAGAKCGGDRIYDLVFDHEYKLVRKDARS